MWLQVPNLLSTQKQKREPISALFFCIQVLMDGSVLDPHR